MEGQNFGLGRQRTSLPKSAQPEGAELSERRNRYIDHLKAVHVVYLTNITAFGHN
jgi:hypothetical protein